ncbi:MAG: hypothetical protein JNK56_18445, partial [Myxococcales bacterium]|nr:hypothetical protein [Myxococcales bacterium]
MPTRSLRSSLALALTLAACGGKGQDTTADATSTTQDASSGLGGSTTSGGSATQSTADPTGDPTATTTPPPTSGPTSGETTNATLPTSDATSTMTSGDVPVCVPDPVPPRECNGGQPKPFVPRFASLPVTHSRHPATGPGKLIDDPDAVFASSGGFIIEPDAGGAVECDI